MRDALKDSGSGGMEDELNLLRSADWSRDMRFHPLPSTRKEGCFVHDLLGGLLLLGRDANVQSFKLIRSPRLLHVATHGFFLKDQQQNVSTRLEAALSQTENPFLRSGLALSGAQAWQEGNTLPDVAGDGVITAQEIRNMDFHGTQVAVLSACETGLGDIFRGQGVMGLSRAFLIAGARAVVMSLWDVGDSTTFELMQQFHLHMHNGASPVDALRAAMWHLRPRGDDRGLNGLRAPAAWAAFTLQGWPFSPQILNLAS